MWYLVVIIFIWSISGVKPLDAGIVAYYPKICIMSSPTLGWKLANSVKNLAEILHIDEIISYIPAECDRLILIPHRFLHLLPLHALPLGNKQDNGHRKQNSLLEKFPRGVGYAPSCQLLQLSQNLQRPNFSQLLVLSNGC